MVTPPIVFDARDTARMDVKRPPGNIVWQLHYDGLVTVAYYGGKAVAGISGPWSDRYALTWWAQPMQAGQLELFDSMEAAKFHVANQIRPGDSANSALLLGGPLRLDGPRKSGSWMTRAWRFMFRRCASNASPHATFELMRQQRMRQDTDLSGVHFHAFE